MSELACNIVSYRPDPAMLAANFRPWHVEALLDQAATLIDRCLKDFRQYSALDYAWNKFQADLEFEINQLAFDRWHEPVASADMQDSTAEDPENPSGDPGEQDEEAAPAGMAPATGKVSADSGRLDLRTEALRRKKELSAPGKPLALDEQRDLTLKRLCRDYEEALNRACVAEEGLKKYYDYAGLSSPVPSEAETLNASISNLAIWIRYSTEWLSRYQQMEQQFTRVVSMRSLINRNTWTQLKQSRESFSTKLQVPADLFRSHDNCRLRGIGALLVGEAGTVPWSVIVRLPDDAVYERSGQIVEVDQSALAPCLLGRVESRRSVRPVEICGVNSLLNASPIGRSSQGGLWSLDILRPSGAISESFGHLDDVLLEVYAVGTPPIGKS